MKYLLLMLCFSILLTGCITTPKITVTSPEKLIINATTKIKQHRWLEAEKLLNDGMIKYPKNQKIKKMLSDVRDQWMRRKQRLEDWMVVYDIEALLAKRPLLVSISQSDPDDNIIKSRLLIVDLTLNSKLELLIDCTHRQFKNHLQLAKRCIVAAEKIQQSIEVKTLLKRIMDEQSGLNKKQQLKEDEISALSRANEHQIMLIQAQKNIDKKLYYEALKLLEFIILQDKNNETAHKLIKETKTFLDQKIIQLIEQGDELYKEERIDEALIIWSRASMLNPANKELIQRLERARKVKKKLDIFRINNSN